MADDDARWKTVHSEIYDMQEIELLLLGLSALHRNKDADTEAYRASDGWCFGLRALRSERLAGECGTWKHKFEMAYFLCDALCLPRGSTFTIEHSEKTSISADGSMLPQTYSVTIHNFKATGAALHRVLESVQQVYSVALMYNEWG